MTRETISITTPDGEADTYVTRPDEGTHPGVLLLMDAIGLRPQIEQMADRIAGWGYAVMAPNLFYRAGSAQELAPTVDLREPGTREGFFKSIRPHMRQLTTERAMADVGAYLAALHGLPGVAEGPVGVTGYCMGGRLSFVTAATYPDQVAAAGAFHAGGLVGDGDDSPHLLADRVRAELVFGHADQDRSMPAGSIAILEATLDQAGVTYDSSVYSGASHGYTMADTSMYDEPAAERHFTALHDLFARALP